MSTEFHDSTQRGNLHLIRLKPEKLMGSDVVDGLGDELVNLIHRVPGGSTFVLDWAVCTYLSSQAIGMLVKVLRTIRGAKGRVIFCSLQPAVAEVLTIVSMDRLFQSCADLPSALKAIEASTPSVGDFERED